MKFTLHFTLSFTETSPKQLKRTWLKHCFEVELVLLQWLKNSPICLPGFFVLLWSFYSSLGLSVHSSLCLYVLSEYLEVVWRSLASENPECPQLVKKASDTLAERLKDPKTYDNITKDFKYSTLNLCNIPTLFVTHLFFIVKCELTKARGNFKYHTMLATVSFGDLSKLPAWLHSPSNWAELYTDRIFKTRVV